MPSSAAACLLRRPLTIKGSTSRSRGVSDERHRWRSASSAPFCWLSRLCARAALIASIRSSFLKGLVRKSTAPALIVRTEEGMSPCPVMNTIGGKLPCANWVCRSSPLMSGSRTSSTRQLGMSGFGYARYSAAQSNVTVFISKLKRSSDNDSRIRRSSSTIRRCGLWESAIRAHRTSSVVRKNSVRRLTGRWLARTEHRGTMRPW